AGPALLDTYEAERKPVGKFTVEQAYTRYVTRTAPYLGAKDFEPVANDFNIELGYLYCSPAICAESDEGKVHDDPRRPSAAPARARRISGSSAAASRSPPSTWPAAPSSCSRRRRARTGAAPRARPRSAPALLSM